MSWSPGYSRLGSKTFKTWAQWQTDPEVNRWSFLLRHHGASGSWASCLLVGFDCFLSHKIPLSHYKVLTKAESLLAPCPWTSEMVIQLLYEVSLLLVCFIVVNQRLMQLHWQLFLWLRWLLGEMWRILISEVNTMTKSKFQGITSTYVSQSSFIIVRGTQGRTRRQELELRPLLTGLLPTTWAALFLIAPRATCPGV